MFGLDSLGRLQEMIEARGEELTSRGLLTLIRDGLDLLNVAYLALHVPPLTRMHFYSEVTYSDEWVDRYISQEYVKIDPVMPAAAAGIMPVDWADIDRSSRAVRDFFADAEAHGVGNQGITIPIRGANGERAFFSINMQATPAEWRHFKNQNMSILQAIGHFYHNKVLESHGIVFPDVALTPRQKEVLRWAANGKSIQDTAIIMQLSRHTVQRYLETTRFRLQAINTVHAVARAIQLRLIDPPE